MPLFEKMLRKTKARLDIIAPINPGGRKTVYINIKKRRTVASPNTKKTVLKNVNLSITPILSLLSLNIGMKLQEEMGEKGH